MHDAMTKIRVCAGFLSAARPLAVGLPLFVLVILPLWATPASAGPNQSYPESRSLNDDVLWIAKVRMGNQRFNSKNDGDGYEDHTGYTFTLNSGTVEYLSLHPYSEPSGELGTYWLVWMDLNRDGDFEDSVNGTRKRLREGTVGPLGRKRRGLQDVVQRDEGPGRQGGLRHFPRRRQLDEEDGPGER